MHAKCIRSEVCDCCFSSSSHISVVYVASNQTNEVDMLSNCYGSDRYARFVRCLGDEVPVGGANNCIGGLTEQCGEFTYCYQDPVNRVIYSMIFTDYFFRLSFMLRH